MQRWRDAGCEGETSEAHHQRRNLWNFLVMAPSRQARQDPERGAPQGATIARDPTARLIAEAAKGVSQPDTDVIAVPIRSPRRHGREVTVGRWSRSSWLS